MLKSLLQFIAMFVFKFFKSISIFNSKEVRKNLENKYIENFRISWILVN